jgi:hypothetical protein
MAIFIPSCDAILRLWGTHAQWPMKVYFSKYKRHPSLVQWIREMVKWLLFQNLSWVVNFFICLVYILHDFSVEIVRCSSSFQWIILCGYFKLVKCPGCFITIRSMLKMMVTSVFLYWQEDDLKRRGIRNHLILCGLWYIFYTILLNIFLPVWSFSDWVCCRLNIENEDMFHV